MRATPCVFLMQCALVALPPSVFGEDRTELVSDANTLLLLHFNGSLAGVDGESPLETNGVSFPVGLIGPGVHVGSGGFIRYIQAGNIFSTEGTVELWVKPDWDGAQETVGRFFLMVGGFFDNGMLLAIDGAHNLRFIQWGDDPGTPGVEIGYEAGVAASGAGWLVGEWHHLAATWKGATREMTFYVDGQPVGKIDTGPFISAFSGSHLEVGANASNQDSAEATFDELRISDRARSAGEILADHQAGLGRTLVGPFGLDVDSAERVIVAEGADRLTVFEADGRRAFSFGASGEGEGQLRSPTDVAVDGSDNIWVADSGNHRIQKFSRMGIHRASFGSFGTKPGQFNRPEGIHADRVAGALYVADTGNHRVQRFRLDGTIDAGWGMGGVVGTTGTPKHDHTGFDHPTNVAVHPQSGQVYVADFGNQRIEVFDGGGRYVQTFLAVYRPRSLAFDGTGNLYIAGEDPNDSYTAFDGRIRLLKAGDNLLSAHYTGDLDDIDRIEGGVVVRGDGSIVFSDTLNSRLVKTDGAFARPIRDLSSVARGSSVTFKWKTAETGASLVRYGPTRALGSEATAAGSDTTDHEVRVAGLAANTRLYYSVSFPDSLDGSERFTPIDVLNTGAGAGQAQFLRLKSVGLVYLDTDPGAGVVPMTAAQLRAARARYDTISRFYWQSSGFRLWLDYRIVETGHDLVGNGCLAGLIESDLAAAGFGEADAFDAVHATSLVSCGNFGGAGQLFGRAIGLSEWTTQDDFSAIHEVNHSLDSIYFLNELGKYEFNHGLWAVPGSVGRDFTVNRQILRNFLPGNFTATKPPFDKVLIAPDADEDGVPDTSPRGLTRPLSLTEATLGSSTASADSDGDGLSDLQEATALPFHGTDPQRSDSDGDGTPDARDRNPAYRVNDHITRGSPAIDGTIEAGEGWTLFTDRWGYSNDALVPDSNALQDRVRTYMAWDDEFLYLALQGPPALTIVYLDGSADNWFRGPDDYLLSLRNDSDFLSVAVNVGVPDLFRQIDDDGQFSEFFDTDPQFTKPYRGRPIIGHPDDGLGFPRRLVTESDLRYRHGGGGDDSVWEVAIPWSDTTFFRGFAGKEMAIEIDVGGDKLFETDDAARFVLVEGGGTPSAKEVAVDVKPRSCPNRLNVRSSGVLKVAILGTDDLDATYVDPASVRLMDLAPLSWSLVDVASPFDRTRPPEDCSDCTRRGADGRLDLGLRFDRHEVIRALGQVDDGECRLLTLTGRLKGEFGGRLIQGADRVTIIKGGE